MNINYTFRNLDNDCSELIIYFGTHSMETSNEPWNGKKSKKISKVRLILASGIVIAMTAPQLLAALNRADSGVPFSTAVFTQSSANDMRKYISKAPVEFKNVVPKYFEIDDGGQVMHGDISTAFSVEMEEKGVAVTPFVTYDRGETSRILDMAIDIAEQLNTLCRRNFLSGVTLDLPYAYGSELSEFIIELRERLDEKYSLSAVVYPMRGSYDYDTLGNILSNVIVNPLQRNISETPAPYYSAKTAQTAVKKVSSGGVPVGKIVLGIDFGGRIWGAGWDGKTPLNPAEVGKITDECAIKMRYDSQNGASYLDFTVRHGQKIFVGKEQLYPGNYIMSLGGGTYAREMLGIATKLSLGGTAPLGAPLTPVDLWDYYNLWLGTGYFSDIANTFGRDEMMSAYIRGVMIGVGEDKFVPYAPVTRGEAAVIVTRVLQLPPPKRPVIFRDTAGHWAEDYIGSAYESGHMIGGSDGNFRPDAKLSREQAAVLVARLCGISEISEKNGVFTDVPPEHWAHTAIIALHNKGIIKGYADATFKPQNPITREELAIIIDRIKEYT